VNFFGHALVATWQSGSPAFALGAMLPDFATMCRSRAQVVGHIDLAAGVAWHHATDRAFHMLAAFRAVESHTVEQLLARGLRRGPARGAAHVSVELCLDVALVGEPGAVDGYLAALAAGAEPAVDDALSWGSPDGAARWRLLRERLAARGAPAPDAARIAERVTFALSGRPLLELDGDGAAHLGAAMPAILEATLVAAPAILTDLRGRLSLDGGA
jgi:hypothetical protein